MTEPLRFCVDCIHYRRDGRCARDERPTADPVTGRDTTHISWRFCGVERGALWPRWCGPKGRHWQPKATEDV